MQPDTRLLAKAWIETHVPSGSKLLMDGPRYRLIQSPPLNHNAASVDRQIGRASQEGASLARGVSSLMLDIYEEALLDQTGPTYDIQSSVMGIRLADPEFYAAGCFEYVVTSSYITKLFAEGRIHRQRYPESAMFYDGLSDDRRFEQVYRVAPIAWESSGPTISVYRDRTPCQSASG